MSDDTDFYEDDAFGEDADNIDDTYLTFTLEGEEYAIAVKNVKEIVRLPKFIEVPDVPDFIRGVINLRGRVIPLMDARVRLGLSDLEYSERTVAIVLESDGVPTGLVADAVSGVVQIAPDRISAPPSTYGHRSKGRVRAVLGIGCVGQESFAIILDAMRLLGDEALESLVDLDVDPAQETKKSISATEPESALSAP